MKVEIKPDMNCVPYSRKWLYYLLTIPVWLVFIAIFIYLWTFRPVFSFIFLLLFLGISAFQSYCCAHQDCPYVGGFCPAVIGIMPASLISKWLYKGKKVLKSQKRFNRNVTYAMLCWTGLILFPMYWLYQAGIGWAIAYAALHLVYTIIFGLTICPVCAIRGTCPGGKFHLFVRRVLSGEKKS